MFRIKICGICDVETARLVESTSADAIGLNFYPTSPRHVSIESAVEISAAVEGQLLRVGLFVNSQLEEIVSISEQVGLDALQLHGDETPQFIAELATRCETPIVRAFRCREANLNDVAKYVTECEQLNGKLAAVLVDAHTDGAYGGTGHRVDWSMVGARDDSLRRVPLILAGGLTPLNVAEAIRVAEPHGVDVASGVEASPGRKDEQMVRLFAHHAADALART
jgi:phosphoribosylanthranilate isomerase